MSTIPSDLPSDVTVGEALAWARARIGALDARVLLSYASMWSSTKLTAWPERPLPADVLQRFCTWVEERAAGVPVAYLVREREFYGRIIRVTPSVLIPRPETETLVEVAISIALTLPPGHTPRILDLGTGSGCVAITLALELPQAKVFAVDASPEALGLAMGNSLRLKAKVSFAESDWFSRLCFGETFDLIVSNPPYLAQDDPHLEEGDLRFEPRAALVAGETGLEAISTIVSEAPRHLAEGGWLLLEHGWDQAQRVRGLLLDAGFLEVQSWKDLAGLERVSGGRRRRRAPGGDHRPK
ncbi:MAG: peptide chain release factor N(5)-glutamine methyltransferase [Rhodocyclales bacterium]|nr:peptide chain release factor N(5)-glutamine methyltransferase [Rhodocyclales bacterium]